MSIKRKFQLLAAMFLLGLAGLLLVIETLVINEITTKYLEEEIRLVFAERNAIKQVVQESFQPKLRSLEEDDASAVVLQCGNWVVDEVVGRFQKEFGDQAIYKIASTKPRNPKNMAQKFESDIINGMEKQYRDGYAPYWKGKTVLNGQKCYVFAQGQITTDRCLRCHGVPEDAPAALKKRYPPTTDTGYGYQRDHVEAAEFMYIPISFIRSQVHWIRAAALGLTLVAMILGMLGLRVALKKMVAPIIRITGVAKLIADGDIESASSVTDRLLVEQRLDQGDHDRQSGNELTGLAAAFIKMTGNLKSLVTNLKGAEAHLSSTASQITASAIQLESTASQQAAATSQVKVSAKAISQRSHQLVETMDGMALDVEKTAQLAQNGREDLGAMKGAMQDLTEASGTISTKLSTINERTQNITGIMATITKVAEKTNLLSLNASIEAEKAGEHGLGFFVVAREIRRLADQTSVSATSIGRMIKEMRSAVSSGVMEMDKFMQKVNQSVENVARISDGLEAVINQVEGLRPRFAALKEASHEQTVGADEISQAMEQLTDGIESAKESITEFKQVTKTLVDAAENLESEISIFKLDV